MHNSTELTITILETTSLLLTIPANDYAPCTMSKYRSVPAEKGHLARHDGHELDVHVQRQIRDMHDGTGHMLQFHGRLFRDGTVRLGCARPIP